MMSLLKSFADRRAGSKRWRLGLAGLVLASCVVGCGGKPPAAAENAPPAPVEVATPRTLFFGEWTELLGATQPLPNRAARITAAVEGRVLWLLHDPAAKPDQALVEGQRVDKGTIIGRLDDRIVRANRDKLNNALEETKEKKNQADLDVELAQIDVDRLHRLLNRSNAMNDAALPLTSRIELDKARINLKSAESKQKEVVAKRKGVEDELKALDEQLDFFVLRAPITGRLGPIQAVPGQTLAVGATIAEVLNIDQIDVLCFVPPYTASRLALGQKARVLSEKDDAAAPRGEIAFIAVQAQPDSGSFGVKVRFPNPDLRLRGGSVLRIEALTQPEQPRVTIPESALLEDQDPPSVVIVEDMNEAKLGTARKLRAIIGIRDRRWHVVELLRLDDPKKKEQVTLDDQMQFVIKGAYGLEDGDKVKLEEEAE